MQVKNIAECSAIFLTIINLPDDIKRTCPVQKLVRLICCTDIDWRLDDVEVNNPQLQISGHKSLSIGISI